DAIHGFLYSDRSPTCKRMTCLRGGAFVYNADLVRQLCGEIANEKDREKTQDLLSLLQAVIKDNQEDIRIRMAFLAKKYGLVSDSKSAAYSIPNISKQPTAQTLAEVNSCRS